ncbi:hypothetical protein GQF42_29230 [Streptomyces broussonetiae]|uniref:Uncharacterized protein n=1 Tax=Streptomyces broussonetiae TaxID=2686304 RepID=A0A6I6N5R5_9ACTN|nr:hypothetical protein [Streptomyces broussonetiae]QHA06832.1 hypothetical protein GQF42_29230 [Streptomyces broussonetiae]
MNEPIVVRHWAITAAPKAAPAVATTTVLALARIWNANGAEHSVGNAALMTVLAAGAAAGGASLARAGEPVLAATGYAVSGSLALAGVAGYSDGLSLPLLLWALATVLTYCFTARHWRQDRRDALDHQRHLSERREEHAHLERVETIRAETQIEMARAGTAYAEQLASALITRATLPGFDPTALEAAGLPELPAAREGR